MKKYYLVANDVFDIANRIKEIDQSYFIVFNAAKQKFEVHSLCQMGGTYCFTVPFCELDERTVDYARKTRRENIAKIIAQIDFENEKLQKENFKQAKNKLEEILL